MKAAWQLKGWLVNLCAALLDVVAIGAGGYISAYVLSALPGSPSRSLIALLLAQYTCTFFLFGRGHLLYRFDANLLGVQRTAHILQVSSYSLLLILLECFCLHLRVPPLSLMAMWAGITTCVLLEKHLFRQALGRLAAGRSSTQSALIIGCQSEARRLFSFLVSSPSLGIKPVAFLNTSRVAASDTLFGHDYHFRDSARVIAGPLTKELLQADDIRHIFIAEESPASESVRQAERIAEQVQAEVYVVVPTTTQRAGSKRVLTAVDGLLLELPIWVEQERSVYGSLKRLLDIVVSIVVVGALSPLWIAIAVSVKWDSPGPVLFRQERVGQNGRLFRMFKFRSMHVNTPPYARSPEHSSDPRITTLGRWLRKTSMDELPQLLNVIKGDMSLVGPRPEMPYVVQQYDARLRERLVVPQGITGMWQLSADRRFAIHETIEYDLYYIGHRGMFLDCAILIHTAAFAMKGI